MRSRFRRSLAGFIGFALIYLTGSALVDYLKSEPWGFEPFVLVAYVVGALMFVLIPDRKKSDDQQA